MEAPKTRCVPQLSAGTTLVTGGLGGLGQLVAAWDVEHGVKHHVLVGRSGRADAATRILVKYDSCFIAARGDVSIFDEVIAATRIPAAPLHRLLHAGGLIQDATLSHQSVGRVSAVMAPKCAGMLSLHASMQAHNMHESTLFSSVASLLGSGGQANYCAANGWLDAFARGGMLQGRAATSIQWGAWSGGKGS